MDGYGLVVDASYYQPKISFENLRETINGWVFRCTFGTTLDTRFKEHVRKAMEAGFTNISAYAWFRPDQDIKAQVSAVRSQLEGTPVKFVWIDCEQHGMTYMNFPPIFSPNTLLDKIYQFAEGLKTLGVEIGIYTRATWVTSYCKPLMTYMYKFPVWLASYPFGKGLVVLSWEMLIGAYAPKVFAPYFTPGWSNRTADGWQWSGDKFVLPHIYARADMSLLSPSDLNYFSNSVIEKWKIGYISPAPLEHYTLWRCMASLGMKVRTGPFITASDTGTRISFIQTFKVYEKASGLGYNWGRIGENQWVSLNWSKEV